MKKLCSISVILAMLASLLPAGVFAAEPDEDDSLADAQVQQPAVPDSAWPVKFEANGSSYVVYQPQFDKWANNRIEGRSAVAMTKPGADSPEFGVAWLSAQTESSAGMVEIHELAVTKADFPTDSGGSDAHVAALRQELGAKNWQVAQERLQNDLEIDKVASRSNAEPVKNDVPRILFSQEPAILVPIDGVPAMRDVAGTGLKRIVNTRALMLFDPVLIRYYLYVSDHWMEAQKYEGPWTAMANAPAQLEQAKEVAVKGNQVDLLAPDEGDAPVPKSPLIHISTTPTELLQTEGAPQYSPVENTRLLYVTNSPNRIFLDTATQAHYVLISGRWFRARNLGPDAWEYVSAASLPGDFARIPSTHPTESVRAAVAGTPQAREAAIENTVPQVATVTRSAASLSVTYDGNPSFQPIDGTSLQQAVNAPIPVIRVGENSFYALDNGVWFVATSPFGPWNAAASVPSIVYSIPRSSPLHYVTYVRIYDATPEVVYVGYTPGYVGSYVSSDYVVVYGTGWRYRPWIGSVWYGAPVTWGFGFSYAHSWWRPYYRPHYAYWSPRPPCFSPAWGPWHYRPVYRRGATVVNNVTINRVRQSNVTNIYNRWDRRSVAVNRNAQPRPQHAGTPGPGRGYVTRPDGSRQYFGDGGRRNTGSDRDRTAQRRNDGNPPPVRMPNRRADDSGRPDRPGNAQSRNEPPQIQGQNRRWDRDQQNGRRERDDSQRQWRDAGRDTRQLPQAGAQQRPRAENRAGQPPQVGDRDARDASGSIGRQTVRPDNRNNVTQDRRETARPEWRNASPQDRADMRNRRDISRQERQDSRAQGPAPQAQAVPRTQSIPRPQSPQVQAMPRPQAMPQRMPETRAATPQARPRIERNMEGRSARSEGRQRSGGGGGGGVRPEARGGDWRR